MARGWRSRSGWTLAHANNTRSHGRLRAFGRGMEVTDWCALFGVDPRTLLQRIHVGGLSPSVALLHDGIISRDELVASWVDACDSLRVPPTDVDWMETVPKQDFGALESFFVPRNENGADRNRWRFISPSGHLWGARIVRTAITSGTPEACLCAWTSVVSCYGGRSDGIGSLLPTHGRRQWQKTMPSPNPLVAVLRDAKMELPQVHHAVSEALPYVHSLTAQWRPYPSIRTVSAFGQMLAVIGLRIRIRRQYRLLADVWGSDRAIDTNYKAI